MDPLRRDPPPQMPALTPVHLMAPVVGQMVSEAVARFPDETGGVMLGWTVHDATHVRHVVGPGPNARHGPTGFHPDSTWQEQVIADLYQDSGRRLSYLGDWHTHPRGVARPSRLDRATLRTIARHPPARCPQPLMLILGGEPDEWVFSMYQRLTGPHLPHRRVCRVDVVISSQG